MPLDSILTYMYPIHTLLFMIMFNITLPPIHISHSYISESQIILKQICMWCIWKQELLMCDANVFLGIKRWLRRNHRLICSAAQNKTMNLWETDRQSCCPLTGMEAGLLTTTMSSSMWTMVIGSEVTGTSCLKQTNNAELTRSHTLQEVEEWNLYYTVKTLFSWHCYCPIILWWPAQWVMRSISVSGQVVTAKLHICFQTLNIN